MHPYEHFTTSSFHSNRNKIFSGDEHKFSVSDTSHVSIMECPFADDGFELLLWGVSPQLRLSCRWYALLLTQSVNTELALSRA
jgi:hypothetical protein